ncbi:cysteine-rich tail protein 1 [Saccopteryx leptura]|uniref:cysteine-rich tail protein 1 n=1 Tax=Saccopteryx leptura TaxID=249018 RepID=UPI00339D2DA8
MAPPFPRREKAAASSSAHRHWDLTQRTRGQTAIATSGRTMDPYEMVVKNPYAHISIPRAHLRPDLEQQLEGTPSSSELQSLPVGSCTPEPTRLLQPTEETAWPKGAKGAKGAKGVKGAIPVQGQQTWQQPGNPYGSGQRPAGLTYTGLPPIGRGDDIAHHCCCCPCCSCCHCPRFCRCHSCCCVVS